MLDSRPKEMKNSLQFSQKKINEKEVKKEPKILFEIEPRGGQNWA